MAAQQGPPSLDECSFLGPVGAAAVGWAEAGSGTRPGPRALSLRGRSVTRRVRGGAGRQKQWPRTTRATAEVISLLMEIVTEKGKVV